MRKSKSRHCQCAGEGEVSSLLPSLVSRAVPASQPSSSCPACLNFHTAITQPTLIWKPFFSGVFHCLYWVDKPHNLSPTPTSPYPTRSFELYNRSLPKNTTVSFANLDSRISGFCHLVNHCQISQLWSNTHTSIQKDPSKSSRK